MTRRYFQGSVGGMRFTPLALATVLACSSETTPDPGSGATLEPPPTGQGFQLSVEAVAEPGTEIWKCFVYRAPLHEIASVHSVEYEQTPGLHHMTLSTPAFSGKTFPYGMHDCASLTGLMESTTMFFGAQGDAHGTIMLPEGVAAALPAEMDVVHEVHYVNTSAEPVNVFSRVNAYTIPDSQVTKGIWGGQVRDENIVLPPHAMHSEWTRCVMNEDVEVLFLASHTHKLGVEFTVAPFDGHTTGDVFYTNRDLHSPMITQYDPPRVVHAGEGFEYKCTWNNRTDAEVRYGLTADDEMCNLAIVHTPFSQTAKCAVVETSDGVLPDAGK